MNPKGLSIMSGNSEPIINTRISRNLDREFKPIVSEKDLFASGNLRTFSVLKLPEANKSFSETIGLNSLSRFLDIRVLMIGSLFPDIIDKPLGFIGFGDGRSITHTLL